MADRRWIAIVAVVALAVGFVGGYATASGTSKDYAMYVGDCHVVASGGSCMVGDTAFGFADNVAWTDANGVGRGGVNDPGEWPTCLPRLSDSKGVRFAGAWLPEGPDGQAARVVWVDCRGR